MIIRAIRAENFMKFSSLRLEDLPARGVIGVEGPNESGKTTIGEAILFAFFGKTRSSLESSLTRLIRWGADYLSVEVEFVIPGRGEFLIYREIDKYGTNYVKVVDASTRAEAAAGNANVSEFLARTLKFDFFEFHQSFYYDQRQTGLSAEAQATFVDRMAGITQIREAAAAVKKEIGELEREFAHSQRDIGRNLQQMEKYERNAAKIPDLREVARARAEEVDRGKAEQRRRQEECDAAKRLSDGCQNRARRLDQLAEEPAAAIRAGLAEVRESWDAVRKGCPAEREFAEKQENDLATHRERIVKVEAMLDAFTAFRASLEGLRLDLESRLDPEVPTSFASEEKRLAEESRAIARQVKRRSIAALVFFLLAVAAGTAAGLSFANYNVPLGGLPKPAAEYGGASASLLLVALTVVFLVARQRAALRLREVRVLEEEHRLRLREDAEERDRLNALLTIEGPGEVLRLLQSAEGLIDATRVDQRRSFLREHGPLVEPEGTGEYRKALQGLARMERELRNRALKEAQRLERASQEADAGLKKLRADVEKTENEIRECESQAAKREVLAGRNRELEAASRETRGEIDLHQTAIELLDDTGASIRNKIGPTLARYLKEVLPRFTSGRYRDVKMGNDLSLQIFTGDKGDFLERSELSGGTQESVSLALRLATSQAFIAARTRQPQFVFLDEPFRMMDEGRALECLRALGSLSLDIQQIFVIQPTFSEGQRQEFDWLVRTSLGAGELQVPSGPRAIGPLRTGPAAAGPAATA